MAALNQNLTLRQCRKCREYVDLALLERRKAYGRMRYFCKEGCQATRQCPQAKAATKQKSNVVTLEPKSDVSTKGYSPKELKVNPTQVKRYLITAAQNNTRVHKGFLAAIRKYCEVHNAELVVIPFRYRNPTSPEEGLYDEVWYDSAIAKDIVDERLHFPNLVVLSDLSIQPTAVNPLSSLEPLANGKSAIVAHPQIALKCVPTPKGELPLLLTSTGAVTQKNYSLSKAGKKGEFHHSYGSCILEIQGDRFHLRNISAHSDGSFIDSGIKYTASSVAKVTTKALVMGDLHIGSTCPQVTEATEDLIDRLKPEKIILHDCFDGEKVNHHELKDPFAKYRHTFESLSQELAENARTLSYYESLCDELVIVASNHNDFLYRWLQRADWKHLDTETARFYLETAYSLTGDGDPNIYAKEMQKRGITATFLKLDESYKIEKIELGQHGHLGSNGSRGSDKQFAKTGSKMVVGHRHTPGIEKGCYTVGTSTHLSLSYTDGLSSWLNTHCLIYEGGKRQLIHIIDGEYTFNSEETKASILSQEIKVIDYPFGSRTYFISGHVNKIEFATKLAEYLDCQGINFKLETSNIQYFYCEDFLEDDTLKHRLTEPNGNAYPVTHVLLEK